MPASDDPFEQAFEAAGRLIAHRARSEHELRGRLARKGHDPEVVDAVVERCLELRLLDDAAFARERAGGLARRGTGPRLMRARLAAAGVDEGRTGASIEAALEGAGGEEALARETLRRRYGDPADLDDTQRRKAAAWLVRRGFSPSVAGRVCGIFADAE